MPDGSRAETTRALVRDACRALDVRRLVLSIHDASFPSEPEDDTGRGCANSPAGLRFLEFVSGLGFDGLQLGPAGETSRVNASPYDGTLFSRNTLSIALSHLAERGAGLALLSRESLHRWVAERPRGAETRVPYAYVYQAHREALGRAFEQFQRLRHTSRQGAEMAEEFERFCAANAAWLEPDALFEVLQVEHGEVTWHAWEAPPGDALDVRLLAPRPGEEVACANRRRLLEAKYQRGFDFYRFRQFLAHRQHQRFRAAARELSLRLYGDLHIGLAESDAWARQPWLLPGYRMGAPPSRTNPEGQPWGYPIFDPAGYGDAEHPGPVLHLVRARMEKMFEEFDAVRIDHPHGLVCPWVYHADDEAPLYAVQHGARLFSSPDLPDHPALVRYAIVPRAQLCALPETARYAENWVVQLQPRQIDRYAIVFDELVAAARRSGSQPEDLVCEVLSTLPYPLSCVLERHGLGRFRVVQKANLDDPEDVYRSENAAPRDWIMVGNHDTEPAWLLVEKWTGPTLERRVRHAASLLVSEPAARPGFARALERDPGLLAHALFAELFVSPAQHVQIFFADLFGIREVYNRPGTVSPNNWSLRLSTRYRDDYRERLGQNRALNLPLALAWALRGRGRADGSEHQALLERLEMAAVAAGGPSPAQIGLPSR